MSPLRGAPSTVRQITIAAMLGVLPSIAAAQHAAEPDTTAMAAKDSEMPGLRRVAARAIPRGAVLTALDIAYASNARPDHPLPHSVAVLDSIPRPAIDDDSLVGWTTRRMIKAGEVLRAPAIIPPQLVKAGELVELQWHDGSILITAKGHATRSASAGERVSVRLASQQSVEGSVVGAGRVRID
jgi:flagella basal body P-ring formation protein FlgA